MSKILSLLASIFAPHIVSQLGAFIKKQAIAFIQWLQVKYKNRKTKKKAEKYEDSGDLKDLADLNDDLNS